MISFAQLLRKSIAVLFGTICHYNRKKKFKQKHWRRYPKIISTPFENLFRLHGQSQFKLCVATENISVENLGGWLSEFQETNYISLKVKVKKKPTKGYLVQKYYRCQHNTRVCRPTKDPQRGFKVDPTARVKNTNCPFQLVIKIDSCNVCSIDLAWEHNHSTDNLEASNFTDLCTEVIEKIKKLYSAGHTPSTARQQYLEDLRVIFKDDMEFHVKKADRSTTPRRRDFRYIYEQFGKETFGGKHDGMFHKLVETV